MHPASSLCWRDMQANDLPEVLRIEQATHPFPWTAGIFNDCLNAGYLMRVICDAQQRIQGYCAVAIGAGEAHLLNITIALHAQGQGQGRALLQALMTWAKHAGAQQLFLEVRPSNQRARQLYETCGFNEIGRRPRYYPAPGNAREDAIVMAMELL